MAAMAAMFVMLIVVVPIFLMSTDNGMKIKYY